MSSKSCQFNTSCTAQLGGQERFYLTKTKSPYSPSQVYGKGKKHIQSPTAPSF